MPDITGIGEAASAIKDVLGMFFPDKTEEEKAKIAAVFQMAQLQSQANTAQIAVNQAAAGVQGFTFRDGAGWVCVAGFAVNVLRPLISWGFMIGGHPITLPEMDVSQTTPMLLGLLGLGGMHMNERIKGRR